VKNPLSVKALCGLHNRLQAQPRLETTHEAHHVYRPRRGIRCPHPHPRSPLHQRIAVLRIGTTVAHPNLSAERPELHKHRPLKSHGLALSFRRGRYAR